MYSNFNDSVYFTTEDNLSSYVTIDGRKKRYHTLSDSAYTSYFNTDILRNQLNCPLYGVNPRGKAPYIGSENILKNGSNFTTIRNFFNTSVNVSNPQNLYPGYTETTNIRYYHSTNLGIRYVPAAIAAVNFTVTSNILPNDGIRYNRYLFASSATNNGLTYINNSGGVVSSDILLFTQTIDGAHYTTSFDGNSYQLPRFSGYYDFGIMEFSNTENKFNFNSDVGFYIKEAILNNFANTSVFGNFVSDDQPGHPLTVDYTAKYIKGTQLGQPDGTIVPKLNDGAGDSVNGNASGVYTTKAQSIIFDSGSITPSGTLFLSPGNGISYNARNYEGAIGNPKDGLDVNGVRTREPRRTTIKGKYNPNRKSYNFCVTIPNWRDYLIDSSLVNNPQPGTPYYNEALLNTTDNDDIKRFSDFFDKLRFVVYTRTDIPEIRGITLPTLDELNSETHEKSLKNLGSKFNLNDTSTTNYTLAFNNPTLCTPTNATQPCLCEDYTPSYNSNCYVYGSGKDVCSWISGKRLCDYQQNSRFFSNGLGSLERCNCGKFCEDTLSAGGCHAGIAAFCSCGTANSPCSCQGESIAVVFGDCISGADDCEDPCESSPCFGDCTVIEKYLGYSNVEYRRYGTCENPSYLIRLRPTNKPDIPAPTELINAQFQLGSAPIYLIKGSMCGEITCPSVPQGSDGLNTTNFTFFTDSLECGAEFGCVKNRCIFTEKSCNHILNGPPTSAIEDYDAIKSTLNLSDSPMPLRLCGIGPQSGANVSDPLDSYPNQNHISCANQPFTDTFINKLIPIEGSEPLCIPLECSVIDCSQYEDCSPT